MVGIQLSREEGCDPVIREEGWDPVIREEG
jgi:hypothetical protein